jgi:carboxyl-terminal processing protease
VQLAIFSDSSAEQLRRAVEALRGQGMRTLVLDLRGDPGGLLTEGVDVADEFLQKGQMVVSLRGRTASETRTVIDQAPERWPDLILIVLTDGGSASASELVSGAWQDHDRAVVVGSTSYGKGSAQSIFPLEGDSGALRLTTALWYTPSGRSIQRRPRTADTLTAADTMAEPPLATRKEYRTDAGRVVYGGGGITPDLIVAPQDSVDGEYALTRALGRDLPRFRDLVVDEAASARASGAVQGTVITVTPAMREALWKLVEKRGLHLQRAQFDSASAAVDRMLGDEIARDALGSDAAFRQRLDTDRVVVAALGLAAGATSQRDVLQRAADRRAGHHEDVAHSP